MFHKLVIILLLVWSCGIPKDTDLTKNQALEDIEELQANFHKFHPGIHRYMSKDSMDYFFDQVKSSQGACSTIELYKDITFLLNKVRCGHTRASLPENVQEEFINSTLFLALKVKYWGNRLFVESIPKDETKIRPGDEIISINGKSINDITKTIFSHHSSDGFINSNKFRLTERYFSFYYQLYLADGAQKYTLEVKNRESFEKVDLAGKDYNIVRELNTSPQQSPLLELQHHDTHSYMKIGTFSSNAISRAGLDYSGFLENSFREIKERGVKNLVLDLRNNGGGRDNYGALLVSYFAKKSFKYFDRIEVTPSYSGYGDIKEKNGMRLVTSHRGLSTWEVQKNSFQGKLIVLINGWSFSTCADVATVLHFNKWATFVGEETGGGYDGNTSGSSKTLHLSNSKIRINVPMWMYTTANKGHPYFGRGVIPDHEIIPRIEDRLQKKDVVLEKALSLID